MNCKTFNKLLPEYLYGESSIQERDEVQAHVRSCPDCRRLLDEMSATVSLLNDEEKCHFSAGEKAALRMKAWPIPAEIFLTAPIHPVGGSGGSRLYYSGYSFSTGGKSGIYYIYHSE